MRPTGFLGLDDPRFYERDADLLWRLRGRPAASTSHHFTDVAPGAWYADALDWADEAGVDAERPTSRKAREASLFRWVARLSRMTTVPGAISRTRTSRMSAAKAGPYKLRSRH